jgi:predicted ATP-binding protein involved in virulence
MKIKTIKINDYKIFKNFSVDFTDKEGKFKNIIVLAGINGSGKISRLEYIQKKVAHLYLDENEIINIETEFGIGKDNQDTFFD